MPSPPFHHPKRVLLGWRVALVVAMGVIAGINLAIASYVSHMRATDYRAMLATASQHIQQNNYPEALNQVERALKAAPDRPEPLEVLGLIHYRLENWPKVVDAFKAALDKGSKDPGAREIIVWALIEMGEYSEAVAFGKQILQGDVVPPALHRYLAEALFRGEQFQEAIEHLELALQATPNDLYVLDHLRYAYEATGDANKADNARRRIEEIHALLNGPQQPEMPSLRAQR